MTWRELTYQLNQWDKNHPNLLDQPAIFNSDPDVDTQENGVEIDYLGHINLDGEDSTDERIPENTILIATPQTRLKAIVPIAYYCKDDNFVSPELITLEVERGLTELEIRKLAIPFIINREREAFNDDDDDFDPSIWLEEDDNDDEEGYIIGKMILIITP